VGTIAELIVQHGVFVVALLVLLGQLGVPTGVSAEVMLLLTGCYAVHSLGDLVGTIALVAAADLVGAAVLFAAARRGGVWLAARRRAPSLDTAARNPTLLLVCRSLPLVRMPATIAAGLMRLPPRRFLAGSSLAGLVWGAVPLSVGYLLRTDVRALAADVGTASQAALWLLPATGAILAFVRWWDRRTASSSLPMLVPARLVALRRHRSTAYGWAPVANGSSGWLLHSIHEPIQRRRFG
jgi:membrane protein DedA with SNARE-associated domain